MPETKIIKLVTIIILEKRLIDEQDNVLLFSRKCARIKKPIMFPKKCMYNFEKIVTWFPHWQGRYQARALKFQIPLWLYEKRKDADLSYLGQDIIIENTHL